MKMTNIALSSDIKRLSHNLILLTLLNTSITIKLMLRNNLVTGISEGVRWVRWYRPWQKSCPF